MCLGHVGDSEDDGHGRLSISAGTDSVTFGSDAIKKTSIPIHHDELVCGYKSRERLLGKIEGIQLASRHAGTELSLAECYKLCGIEDPGEDQNTSETGHEQASTRPSASGIVKRHGDDSPLSDCPSDLSEWEVDEKVRLYCCEYGQASIC
jgi:hypothetical protein